MSGRELNYVVFMRHSAVKVEVQWSYGRLCSIELFATNSREAAESGELIRWSASPLLGLSARAHREFTCEKLEGMMNDIDIVDAACILNSMEFIINCMYIPQPDENGVTVAAEVHLRRLTF